MSAADLAAVLVAVVVLAVTVGLTLAAVSLVRTMRELRATIDELRSHAVPAVVDLRSTVESANAELEKVDELIDTAQRISTTVDSASRLTYRALTPPVFKTMSLVAGTRRMTRRLRGRPAARPIDVTSTERPADTSRRRGRRALVTFPESEEA